MKCVICKKDLPKEANKNRKYCSKRCNDKAYYLNNKQKCLKRAENWKKNNPEKSKKIHKKAFDEWKKKNPKRYKELMKKNYENNKQKWKSRRCANYHKREIFKIKGKKCQKCGTKTNLKIHHLDYIWKKEEFAGKKGKINLKLNIHKLQLLCKNCHKKEHKNTTFI